MKTRFVPYYPLTSQAVTSKATGVTTVNVYRPLGGYEQLVVLQDQLHGDKVTVYPHEFRKLIQQEYLGVFTREDNVEELLQRGQIASFTRYVDAEPQSWDNVYNQAVANLYEQMRSGDYGSGLDLSVDIAEAHQVRKLFGQFTKLNNFVRSFKPSNWHSKWLEYQYGWRPLINSAYGTFDALMHRRTYSLFNVVGKGSDRFTTSKSYRNLSWTGSLETVNRDAHYRAKLCCTFEIKNTIQQQLAGYTSLNPVSIAWELVPYSFVADWFIDVGGYLRSLESACLYGQGFKSGYIVYGYKDKQDGFLDGQGKSGNTLTFGSANAYVYQSYKRRGRVGVYPLPVLPHFKADLGWQRLISGASLLKNFLR